MVTGRVGGADDTAVAPLGDRAALDRILAEQRIVVVVGPGGVGKTTLAAALAIRAARHHGRRVVVVTVDPARRLAEALGMARLVEEPILVPVGERGRLWALMVDMARGWDRVVEATAPDGRTRDRLLANRLYRTLTRRFVQSHDYIALDHLLALHGDEPAVGGPSLDQDLVVVDTPPSRHAIDLMDAPGRMIEFFDSRLLRWLTLGAGSGIGGAAARPFLAVAQRLLGGRFLAEIVEFFTVFALLRSRFVARSRRVDELLASAHTSFVAVTTADGPVVDATQELLSGLAERHRSIDAMVVNRFLPGLSVERGPAGWRLGRHPEPDLSVVGDPSAAAAIAALTTRARAARLPMLPESFALVAVPLTSGDLTDVAGLTRLLDAERSSPDPDAGTARR